MMARSLLILALASLSGLAAPLRAQTQAADFRQIRNPQDLTVRPDRAYLLLRMDTSIGKFSAALLRVPGQDELAAYEAAKRSAHAKAGAKAGPLENFTFAYKGRSNLFDLASSKPVAKNGRSAIVLAEVTPGDYVLYGQGFNEHLYQCYCLGTVGFSAPAGQITDLGTMLFAFASRPSEVPELAGEVNLGPSAFMDYALWAAALRPQLEGQAMPAGVEVTRVHPARLRAIGPFFEPNTLLVNRLAPIPGVLAYDKGRVIDVASGTEARAN